jgi:hypothetical protein
MPGAVAAALGKRVIRRGPAAGSGFVSDEEPLIIVGMHRSGTSIMSDLLMEAGVYLGGSQVDQYQESMHFSRANRAMLGEAAAQLFEFGWAAPKRRAFIEARRGYAEEAAKELPRFLSERKGEPVWGWKDPRTSLTLDVWLSIFPNARVLHILRDGRTVALSLADRDELEPSFALALWAHHVAEAERSMGGLPEERRLTVRYEDFVALPKEVLGKMLAFAGIDIEVTDEMVARVDASVASGREADPRIAEIRDDPMLARFGYT